MTPGESTARATRANCLPPYATATALSAHGDRRTNADLLADLLQEGLRAQAMAGLVLDDLARQSILGVRRATGAVADFARQLRALGRGRPNLLFDGCDQTIRTAVMRGLGLGHVMKTGVCRTVPRPVATRTSRGEAKGIANSAVPSANSAAFRRQRKRSIPERRVSA